MRHPKALSRRTILHAAGITVLSAPVLVAASEPASAEEAPSAGVGEVLDANGTTLDVKLLHNGVILKVTASDFGDAEPTIGDLVAVMPLNPSKQSGTLTAYPYWQISLNRTVTGYRKTTLSSAHHG